MSTQEEHYTVKANRLNKEAFEALDFTDHMSIPDREPETGYALDRDHTTWNVNAMVGWGNKVQWFVEANADKLACALSKKHPELPIAVSAHARIRSTWKNGELVSEKTKLSDFYLEVSERADRNWLQYNQLLSDASA